MTDDRLIEDYLRVKYLRHERVEVVSIGNGDWGGRATALLSNGRYVYRVPWPVGSAWDEPRHPEISRLEHSDGWLVKPWGEAPLELSTREIMAELSGERDKA